MPCVLHKVLPSLPDPSGTWNPSLWRRNWLHRIHWWVLVSFWSLSDPPSQWTEGIQGFVLVPLEPGTAPGSQEVLMNVCWVNCGRHDGMTEGWINEVMERWSSKWTKDPFLCHIFSFPVSIWTLGFTDPDYTFQYHSKEKKKKKQTLENKVIKLEVTKNVIVSWHWVKLSPINSQTNFSESLTHTLIEKKKLYLAS